MVDDWEVFGASLGVPDRQLECIKKDDPHGGVKTWKLKMFRLLFQNKGNISWNDVVQALRHIDYLDLAEKLEKKYSTQIKEGGVHATVKAYRNRKLGICSAIVRFQPKVAAILNRGNPYMYNSASLRLCFR